VRKKRGEKAKTPARLPLLLEQDREEGRKKKKEKKGGPLEPFLDRVDWLGSREAPDSAVTRKGGGIEEPSSSFLSPRAFQRSKTSFAPLSRKGEGKKKGGGKKEKSRHP